MGKSSDKSNTWFFPPPQNVLRNPYQSMDMYPFLIVQLRKELHKDAACVSAAYRNLHLGGSEYGALRGPVAPRSLPGPTQADCQGKGGHRI